MSVYAGEYPAPLERSTVVQCPVVSGYVTARLRVQGNPVLSLSGQASGGIPDNLSLALLENVGANACTVRLQTCDDRSISGPRMFVTSAATLVPSGHMTQSFYGTQTF